MERLAYKELKKWKESERRKPLIINGARQVGKTYLLREFGKNEYRQCAYINCDSNRFVDDVFVDYDTKRIIMSLSAALTMDITPGDTLIILDEIQENPRALNSLKYFCENAPEYHIAVAGSLLGISLHSGVSFPVGKVDMIKLFPLTFNEFLLATRQNGLYAALVSRQWDVVSSLQSKYIDLLRQYYYVGGMPEVVQAYIDGRGLTEVRNIQKQILFNYKRDFSKHTPERETPRVNMVWDSIPSQLAKDNQKFIYGALKKGARANDFEIAIQWLIDAGLIYKVSRISTPTPPLKFYEDLTAFKLFMLDVGLMGAMANVDSANILLGESIFSEYKGAFTELYVLTQLMGLDIPVYYYSTNDSKIEIDFLIEVAGHVVPIEVKAEENVKSKSLKTYIDKHPELKGLRLSMKSRQDQEWMENLPLYAFVDEISGRM